MELVIKIPIKGTALNGENVDKEEFLESLVEDGLEPWLEAQGYQLSGEKLKGMEYGPVFRDFFKDGE